MSERAREADPGPRSGAWGGEALAIGLGLLAFAPLVASLVASPVVPSHDGPKTLYASHALLHVGEPPFASELVAGRPLTAFGFTLVHGALERPLGWRLAYALAVAIVASLVPIGVLLLARSQDRRRAPVALAAVAAAYPWALHMGFVNYVASAGLGFVALAIGLGAADWSRRRVGAVFAALAVATIFHPLGAQLAAVGLFAHRAAHTSRERAARDLGAVALGCLPVVVVTVAAQVALSAADSVGEPSLYLGLGLGERLESFGRWFLSGPAFRPLGVALVAAAAAIATAAAAARGRFDRRATGLVAVAAVALVLALTTPMHASRWQYFQPRFAHLAVLALVPLFPFERLPAAARRLAVLALFAHAVASNAWVAREHARFFEEHGAAFAHLADAPSSPGRTLLPVVALPEIGQRWQRDRSRAIPSASFLTNLGELYGVARTALTPYTFSALRYVHLVESVGSSMPRVPSRGYGDVFLPGADPKVRSAELGRLASYGLVYDDVLFYGAEDDARELLAFGFAPEARAPGFAIARFVGCARTVVVSGAPPAGEAGVQVAFGESGRIAVAVVVPGTWPTVVDVPRGPCGRMGVRLGASDAAGPLRCRGADAEGFLRAAEAEVRCVAEPSPRAAR